MKKQLILASSSPRRKKILEDMKVKFEVIPSNIDENIIEKKNAIKYVQEIAKMKADKVRKELSINNAIIIGADTVVLIDNDILGKQASKEEIISALKRLSGKFHKVLTGIAVIDTESGKILQDYEESEVKFKKLSEETINNYINSMCWKDKAGGYNIEEVEEEFVEEIKGDYYNILGLPVKKLDNLLKKIELSLKEFIH